MEKVLRMQRRKRVRKPPRFYLLYAKNSWSRKDELPDIDELESEYYRNRDKVKVEEIDVPNCLSLHDGRLSYAVNYPLKV